MKETAYPTKTLVKGVATHARFGFTRIRKRAIRTRLSLTDARKPDSHQYFRARVFLECPPLTIVSPIPKWYNLGHDENIRKGIFPWNLPRLSAKDSR